MIRPPPRSPLFPSPPLSRSSVPATQVIAFRSELDWATLGAIPEMLQTAHGSLTVGLKHLGKDRKSTRLNSSHSQISYAVFCLKKKKKTTNKTIMKSYKIKMQ